MPLPRMCHKKIIQNAIKDLFAEILHVLSITEIVKTTQMFFNRKLPNYDISLLFYSIYYSFFYKLCC